MAFDLATRIAVWEKATVVPPNGPDVFRKDVCGAWIRLADYGNRDSQFGWEIDHIVPGGSDDLTNLRPLHWRNNAARGDGPLVVAMRADGIHNKPV